MKRFFFPEYGKSVEAETCEEALKKINGKEKKRHSPSAK